MSDGDETEALTRCSCLELLRSRTIGRVALSQHALPTVIPVAYRLVGDRLVFTAPADSGILFDDQPVVAFQVDDVEPDRLAGWNVVVVGPVVPIAVDHPSWSALSAAGTALLPNRLLPDPNRLVAGLTTDHISGRRFRPIPR